MENNIYNTLLRKIKQVKNSLSVWLRSCEKSFLICLFLLSSVTKSSAKKKYFYGRQKNHKTLKNVAVNTGSQFSQEFEEENPATFPSKLGEKGNWGDIPIVSVICDLENLSQVFYIMGRCFLSLQNMLYLQNFNLCLTIRDSISLGTLSKKFLQRNSFVWTGSVSYNSWCMLVYQKVEKTSMLWWRIRQPHITAISGQVSHFI